MLRRDFVATAASMAVVPCGAAHLLGDVSLSKWEPTGFASGSAALDSFRPSLHGWPFSNFESSGLVLNLGNCGGMSWAALDRFINRHSARVSLSSDLRDQIEKRQRDTLDDWLWAKVAEWQQKPSNDSGPLQPHSLKYSSREEWPTIKRSLDRGIPIDLILIIAEPADNPGKNHQVLAYSYSKVGSVVKLGIYDSNQPDKDDLKIQFTTSGDTLGGKFINSDINYNRLRGFMAVDYDRTLNVHTHRLTNDGKVGARVDHRAWSRGWDSVAFHYAGGQPGVILLKSMDGEMHAHSMDPDGVVGGLQEQKNWTSGWTELATYDAGGATYMLLMKRFGAGEDGKNVHIHKVEANGSVGPKLYAYDWSEGWTNAVPYLVGTQPYVLLLKKGTGIVHVQSIKSDGSIGARVDTRNWTSGWSVITPYEAGGNTYLFFLKTMGKADDGKNVHIHRIDPDGKVGPKVHAYSWTEGWTSATPFTAGSQPYLVILKDVNGRARIHKINANGGIGTMTDDRDWSSGWSSVKTFKQNGTNYLFLLKDLQVLDKAWVGDLIEIVKKLPQG